MNRGLAYQDVFSDRVDRELFLNLIGECHQMWGIQVLAYCLMGNHYHLLFQTPQGNLSRVMRHLDGLYTQRYNRRHHRDGPLFRGRYKSIVVDEDVYLLGVARYIHRNPKEAGLVQRLERYAWSSYRVYMKKEKRPQWLDVNQLMGRFAEKGRLKAFQEYMGSEVEEEVRKFYSSRKWVPVWGSEGFVERVRKIVKKSQKNIREIPEAKRSFQPTMQKCLAAVKRVYGIKGEKIKQSRRGERNEARAMGMYVCRWIGGMKQEEIAKEFRLGGYSGVSSTIRRMKKELERGGKELKKYKEIEGVLGR